MQKPKPEDRRSLTAQSLKKSCHNYKYFTLESEPIDRSNPSFQLRTLVYKAHSLTAGWVLALLHYATKNPGGKSLNKGKEGFLNINSQPDNYVTQKKHRRYGLSPLKMKRELNPSPSNKPRLVSTFGWAPHIKFLAQAKVLRRAQLFPDKRWQNPSKSHYNAGHLK